MKLYLLWLKAWIDYWCPRDASRRRLVQFVVAFVTLPAVLLVYMALVLVTALRGPLRMVGVLPGGNTLECQLPDVVQFYVFLFGVWEPDISAFVQQRLSAGDVFCDVGAHVGYYSLLAAAAVGPAGHVVAIEASPFIFQQLQHNVSRNQIENIRTLNRAATAQAGVVEIHRGPPWNLGLSTTRMDGKLSVECQIPALPLTELLKPEERQKLRLIKVDVEGTERDLFPGLLQVLSDAPQYAEVVLELSPRWWAEPKVSVEEALQTFTDAGYHIYVVDNDYSPWRYFWSARVRPPRRHLGQLKSWFGQYDIVLSRVDQEELAASTS